MLHSAVEALQLIVAPSRLLILLLGVLLGLAIGLLPGLGGTAGMALLLPFIFGMDQTSGIALLVGMMTAVHTSESIPCVMLGIPGSAGAQATIMDGYPLARKGEAGRALGAAFSCCLVGGIIGGFVILGSLQFARPLVLAFGSPQLFMLTLLGLSTVGILTRGARLAGLLTGVVGLVVGSVGTAPAAPVERFTFGSLYLSSGLSLPVIALGLFALPELFDLLAMRRSVSSETRLGGGMFAGVNDAWHNKRLVAQSSILGSLLGAIPGLGGPAIDWITYGVGRATSRNSATFGQGDIRGVIAPESANNSKEGGQLIPTLLFGIPAGATSAMLLGGLVLLGIQTGPAMITTNLNATLTIIWTLVLANVVVAALCFGLSRWISKVSLIPAQSLVPFLFVLLVIGAFQANDSWNDIYTLCVFGIFGWILKQIRWPRPPMLIGFILAGPAEDYLHLSVSLYGASWLAFPSVIAIAGIIAIVIVLGTVRFRRRHPGHDSGGPPTPTPPESDTLEASA